MVDNPRFYIAKEQFEGAFGKRLREHYPDFLRKLEKELCAVVHPSAEIQNLQLVSKRVDAGGNVHIRLEGIISFLNERGEIGGEFVWLKNLNSFRGKAWSSVAISSDRQLLMKARQSLREERPDDAERFLNAIQNKNELPQSAILLRKIVQSRIT